MINVPLAFTYFRRGSTCFLFMADQCKKKPVLSHELFFKDGGEGGIRTPDTLPYTHFPGVLLQPLGHLTKFLLPYHMGGNGALL